MKHLNKKGQIMQELGALGIGVVVITLVLVIAFLVMSRITTQAVDLGDSDSVVNETVAYVNATATVMDRSINSMLLTCTKVVNATDPYIEIGADNYTCGTDGITLTMTNDVFVGDVLVSYTYKDKTAAFNSTGTLTAATATIPGWVPLIILVMIGGIILGLVSAFKRR